MSKLSTLLLDFDGTIVDSSPKHTESILRAFLHVVPTISIDPEERKAYIGLDHLTSVNTMLAQRGIDDEALAATIVARAVKEYEALQHTITCVPGADDFIRSAHEDGLRIGIVSGSPRRHIERILRDIELNSYISLIVSREDVTALKPHPDPYLRAIQRLHTQPNETIAFEDSPSGVESAWLASIPTIGVLTSFEADDLHKTMMTIPHFTQFSLAYLYEIFDRNAS